MSDIHVLVSNTHKSDYSQHISVVFEFDLVLGVPCLSS